MSGVARLEHPAWCAVTAYCRADIEGPHRSRPAYIGGDDESGRYAVALVALGDGPVMVEMVALSDDEQPGGAYYLSPTVAHGLGRTICAHGSAAAG